MLTSFLLQLTGLSCLALSMSKHYMDVTGNSISTVKSKALRIVGYLLLVLSGIAIMDAGVPSISVVFWIANLGVSVFCVALWVSLYHLRGRKFLK